MVNSGYAPPMPPAYLPEGMYGGPPKPKSGALFKTQLCRHFEQKGFCNMGENCSFAHGTEELKEAPPGSVPTQSYNSYSGYSQQPKSYTPSYGGATDSSRYYKTVLCKHFEQTGQCQFGVNCKFAHGEAELKPTPIGGSNTGATQNSFPTPSPYGNYYTQQPAGYYGFDTNTQAYPPQTPTMPFDTSAAATTPAIDPSQNYSYNYGADPNYYQNVEGGFGYPPAASPATNQATVGEGETAPSYYPQAQTLPTTAPYSTTPSNGYQQ